MAKRTSDLFSQLQSTLNKLADKDGTPRELANALNTWAHESADTLKERITEEVDSAVTKLGFIKREEFDRLVAEVAALKAGSASTSGNVTKRKTSHKAAPRKVVGKNTVKKSTNVKKSAKAKKR